ncbi:MAG: hypothetical protein AAF483_10565 [Planctomycetota bacterium]
MQDTKTLRFCPALSMPAIYLLGVCCFSPLTVAQDGLERQDNRAPAVGQDDAEQYQASEIAKLIEQLGHPSYRLRTQAEWALKQYGLAAFEQLHEAATNPSTNIEISNAASYLISSQNVVWYMDSDSVDVRGFLKDYDVADPNQRIARIKMLAEHDGNDGVLALCRLARYERTELLSRTAGVHLIEVLTRKAQDAQGALPTDFSAAVAKSLGPSRRDAVKWIRQLLQDSDLGEFDLAEWQTLCAAERSTTADESFEMMSRQKQHVMQFHGAVANWSQLHAGREAALAIARPCLDFGEGMTSRFKPFAEQLLDDWKMPELIIELSERNEKAFESYELGFHLAEAFLQTGQDELGEKQALKTSMSLNNGKFQRIGGLSASGMEATIRSEAAKRLNRRSMYDWAEREFIKALDLLSESTESSETEDEPKFKSVMDARHNQIWTTIRLNLSQFYWDAGRHVDASAALKPVVDRITQIEESESTASRYGQVYDDSRILGDYHYYLGLVGNDNSDYADAQGNLLKALEHAPANPDIVIAMRDSAKGNPKLEKQYQEKLSEMRELFRKEVVKWEMQRAGAPTRDRRKRLDFELAEACNQLAWLLGKCEENPLEAVSLAERAVGVNGNAPEYLDTLGRCYYSAGEIEKSIRTQRKAVKLAPYDRLIAKQLIEFEKLNSK